MSPEEKSFSVSRLGCRLVSIEAAATDHGRGTGSDVVEEAVFQTFFSGKPFVPGVVFQDAFQWLTGLFGGQFRHDLLHVHDQLGLNSDIGFCTTDTTGWLVHEDTRVRGGVTLAWRARRQQELPHGLCQTGCYGNNIVRDELHGVIDRHDSGYGTAR